MVEDVWLRRLLLPCLFGLVSLSVAKAEEPGRRPEIVLRQVEFRVDAGQLQNHQIDLGHTLAEGVVYRARFSPRNRTEDRLLWGFFDPLQATEPLAIQGETEIHEGEKLHVRVVARRCCPNLGLLHTEILVEPQAEAGATGGRALAILLPVSIQVTGRPEQCQDGAVHSLLRATLWGTLALCLHGMFANSNLLDRQKLRLRLKPLRWNGTRHEEDKETLDVHQMVDRELRFWRRTWNWLRANPLAFGLLPGRAYYETVELILLPSPDASRVILVPQSNLYRDLERHPDLGRDRLFVTAQGDRCFGVPANGRLCGMVRQSSKGRSGGPLEGRIDLQREERLLYSLAFGKQPSPGRSGWQLY